MEGHHHEKVKKNPRKREHRDLDMWRRDLKLLEPASDRADTRFFQPVSDDPHLEKWQGTAEISTKHVSGSLSSQPRSASPDRLHKEHMRSNGSMMR